MAMTTLKDEPRLTDLYASLRLQWAQQTVQFSRSVRLYQERVCRRRRQRATQVDELARRGAARLVPLDARDEGVMRPSLELVPSPLTSAGDARGAGRCPLTARQREIADLIAQGMTNGQIATRIVVSKGTVGNHIGHMLRRLGVKNRAQIAAWAIQHTGQEAPGG